VHESNIEKPSGIHGNTPHFEEEVPKKIYEVEKLGPLSSYERLYSIGRAGMTHVSLRESCKIFPTLFEQ
jgi:hypothetical protein